MHTGDPLKAVKQLSSAAKPGATISMKEGDMDLFVAYPDSPGMKKMLEVFPRLGASKGADPRLGRKLISHLLAAGHSRDDITAVDMDASIVSTPQYRHGWAVACDQIFAEVLTKPEMMKNCEISEEDIALIRQAMPEWAKCEDGMISFPSVWVVCKKAK